MAPYRPCDNCDAHDCGNRGIQADGLCVGYRPGPGGRWATSSVSELAERLPLLGEKATVRFEAHPEFGGVLAFQDGLSATLFKPTGARPFVAEPTDLGNGEVKLSFSCGEAHFGCAVIPQKTWILFHS